VSTYFKSFFLNNKHYKAFIIIIIRIMYFNYKNKCYKPVIVIIIIISIMEFFGSLRGILEKKRDAPSGASNGGMIYGAGSRPTECLAI